MAEKKSSSPGIRHHHSNGKLQGGLQGTYYPLQGSQSNEPRPGGMTAEEEETLCKEQFLFPEPTSLLRKAAAMHPNWPDTRGVFQNVDKNALVWVNNETHLWFEVIETGRDSRTLWRNRIISYARSEHLGYVSTCPSNLGTGLRAIMTFKLSKFGK